MQAIIMYRLGYIDFFVKSDYGNFAANDSHPHLCGLSYGTKYSRIDQVKFVKTALADHTPSNFLKAVFPKFYLVHLWLLCPI